MEESELEDLDTLFRIVGRRMAELSDWEQNFIADMEEKRHEWDRRLRLSPKQWSVINRIEEKMGV